MEDGDTHLDKCMKTMKSVTSGELDVKQTLALLSDVKWLSVKILADSLLLHHLSPVIFI